MIVKEKTMICSCGAVVLEERLIELNSGLLNAYFCPGGSTRQGRFQPPHYEVGRNLKDMTKLSSPIDAVNKKNDEEMEAICAATRPFYQQQLGQLEHGLARINLLQTAMQASKNLPLQLIARSLFEQFAPNMEPLADFVQTDHTTYATYAKKLEDALQARDTDAVRETIEAFAALNRESLIKAYTAAQNKTTHSTAQPLQETASS